MEKLKNINENLTLSEEEAVGMAQIFETFQKDPELWAAYQRLQSLAIELDSSSSGDLDDFRKKKLEKEVEQMKSELGPTTLDALMTKIHDSNAADGTQSINSLKLPGQRKLGPHGLENTEKGILLNPDPGFVVKTLDTKTQTKIFINICQSQLIGEPIPKIRLDDEGNEVEGVNVPVSAGQGRHDTDHSGKKCVIYDCVMNPKVLQDAQEDKTGSSRDFICQLALEYVETKYKCSLDRRYKLPKLKYKGEPATQWVRDITKQPKIQEIASSKTSVASSTKIEKSKAASEEENLQKIPMPVECIIIEKDGKETVIDPAAIQEPSLCLHDFPSQMRFLIKDVKCIDEQQIQVNISNFEINISIPGFYPSTLVLPFPAKMDDVYATLIPNTQELNVLVEVDCSNFETGPDPGSRLWMLNYALEIENETAQKSSASKSTSDILPEAPTVDMNTPWTEDDELPEDRFHRSDLISQHHMGQLQQNRKDKAEKYEKEQEQKKQISENIEYIDPADFRKGGKYDPGDYKVPKVGGLSTELISPEERQTLADAAVVMKTVLNNDSFNCNGTKGNLTSMLSSQLWSELLD